MNVSDNLPKSDADADLLKPSIAELLRQIPDCWSEFDSDKLTAIQSKVLFLLVAAGMVERRFRLHIEMFNHPTAFEATLTATGEYGIVEAITPLNEVLWDAWQDVYQTRKTEAQKNILPFHCRAHKPEKWRLTDQGIMARNDLSDGNEAKVFDFVLKRGFFGPGYFNRTMVLEDPQQKDEQQVKELIGTGQDLSAASRPPVRGSGRLESYKEIKKSDNESTAQSVNISNWDEGGRAFAQVVAQFFEAAKSGKITPHNQTTKNKVSEADMREQEKAKSGPGRPPKKITKQRADFANQCMDEGLTWTEAAEKYMHTFPDDHEHNQLGFTDALRHAYEKSHGINKRRKPS